MTSLLAIFLIIATGYLLGRIRIKGLDLGSAGVLLVALVFGHFGVEVPSIIQNFGLVCFVTSVGFIAGPKFFRNFKANATSYVLLGLAIILSGALACAAVIKLFDVPAALATGLMTGSLTSTPGLAAAMEAAGDAKDMASIGYGIAYPFGVISVVFFVQLTPRFLKANMDEERKKMEAASTVTIKPYTGKLFDIEPDGFFAFAAAVVVGLLLAKITIPLPGGASFSLGTSGGPLIAGLIFGHFAHIGPVNISVNKKLLENLRELGLILFLLGAGVSAGAGFVDILKEYGAVLFLEGAVMALVPMLIGFLVARKLLKLCLFNSLGSICGGMTSTPALGTLIRVTKSDDVASAYAATYPVALVAVVLASQFIVILFG